MSQPRPDPVQLSEPPEPPERPARRKPVDAPDDGESLPIFAADPREFAQSRSSRAKRDGDEQAPLEEGRRFGGRGGFAGVLVGGLRALALMPVRPGAMPVSAAWCALLIAMSLVVAIAGDALLLGPEPAEFNWQSLRAVGLDLLIIVLGGAWLVEKTRPKGGASRSNRNQHPGQGAAQRASQLATRTALRSVIAPASEQAPTPRQQEPTIVESGPDTTIRLASPLDAIETTAESSPEAGMPPGRARVAPLHFATVVFAGSFWLLLVAYALSLWLSARADAGMPSVVPGMWFYNLTTIWPWLIALRAIQYMHRYQPLPGWRRAIVLTAMLVSIGWTLFDPGEPYWVAPYGYESDELAIPPAEFQT